MQGNDSPREDRILIDNELSAMQKCITAATLRIRKISCSLVNIIYIAIFVSIIFLISFMSISLYKDSKRIAIIRGLVSEKLFEMDLKKRCRLQFSLTYMNFRLKFLVLWHRKQKLSNRIGPIQLHGLSANYSKLWIGRWLMGNWHWSMGR